MSAPLAVGSLFSGIGGLDLGLERAGMEIVWQAEIDEYCSRVLAKHWPGVPNLGDVTKIEWEDVERVDLICGGFPCQPVSQAGLGRGTADERWLWPEVARCLSVLRPRYALVENVARLLVLGFGDVLADLAALGYDAEWSIVPACAVGASHARERMFVLAYPEGAHGAGAMPSLAFVEERRPESRGSGVGESRPGRWLPEPALDRMADGIPRRLVRPDLEALGNAVVPQVAEWIGLQLLQGVE